MGSFVTPIAVDLNKVTSVVGSRHQKLVRSLVDEFAHEFEDLDTMIEDVIDADEMNPLTAEEALRQMVMGEPYNDDLGFVYGYVLEFICLHYGEVLTNGEWSSMHHDWIETVDQALVGIGIPRQTLSITHLLYSGTPVPIPPIDDYPGVGYLPLPAIRNALAELSENRIVQLNDSAIQSSLVELRSWLETCVENECDLICFYA